MIFREATPGDIEQMKTVRNSVTENSLSDPTLITDSDYHEYITIRGKGWVCEENGVITGFAVADLQKDNIWALFIMPGYENRGIGKKLHGLMMDWYFASGKENVWLGTAPNTRAEGFYRKMGWTENGKNGEKEIRFEMSREEWKSLFPGLTSAT